MKKEEFFKLAEKITKEELEKYEEAKALWKRKQLPHNNYLIYEKVRSEEFENCHTPDEMIKSINEFYKDIKNLDYHIDGKTSLELEATDYYISTNYYEYRFRILRNKSSIDYQIKTIIKKAFSKLLKPSNTKYEYPPDCKLMTLYKDGEISYKVLQKLTYNNCNL